MVLAKELDVKSTKGFIDTLVVTEDETAADECHERDGGKSDGDPWADRRQVCAGGAVADRDLHQLGRPRREP